MTVLVTGADGFVGRWMVPRLVEQGREVVAAGGPGPTVASPGAPELDQTRVRWTTVDVTDPASVAAVTGRPFEAVVHLAAVASGAESRRNPAHAWAVNTLGTGVLLDALGRARAEGRGDPVVLYASTGEVYGAGRDGIARRESDPVAPCSPYAATKAAGEVAALEVWRRTGLRVVIARAFPHTGPGQDPRFVAPAFVERLLAARAQTAPAVRVGRLDPVREFLDVRDVVDAYLALVDAGEPGEVYNVAGGEAISLRELFYRVADLVGYRAVPETASEFIRAADILHLVGDAEKIRARTGWTARRNLETTLRDLVDAQAH